MRFEGLGLLLAACLLLGGLVVGRAYIERDVSVAVAIARPTPVRDGPTPESRVLFELPEGQFVRIVDTQGDYHRTMVNDSLQGWVMNPHLISVD